MKVYLNEYGLKTYISTGLTKNNWITVKEKKNGSLQRICSINLPIRYTPEEAQRDLDAFAAKRNWKVFEDKENKND